MNTKIILAISVLLAAGASANAAGSATKDFRNHRSEVRASYAQQDARSGPVLIGAPGAWIRNCTYQGGPKSGTWACR